MKLTESSIRQPVAVTVGVILVVLFGLVTFSQIPIQLTPNVDRPQLTVRTVWPGASPYEIEREIVDEQEEFLKNVEGLEELRSESQDSNGNVILEFPAGTPMSEAVIRVSNKLEQVPSYPLLADKPVISSEDARANAIAWLILRPLRGRDLDIITYRDLCEEMIKPELERVPGVSQSNVFGGAEREMRVTVDPHALASRGLTVTQLIVALRAENRNVSAGDFDEGKRRNVVRTVAEFETVDDVKGVVISEKGGRTVYLRDVAEVSFGHADPDVSVRRFGVPGIAMNVQRASGANVLEVMLGLKEKLKAINRDLLAPRGLQLQQVYDETIYIYSAIDLVEQNIIVGGLLAIFILFLFLRSGRSVLVIGFAIPISVIGTFLLMYLMGRNINVISLAGMSFAVGMVVDNSIVVLENIYRHVQMGKDRWTAAKQGTSEVWGAVLASTLTTMAVFIPILFMVTEAGQLFKDIAIAISSAVALSLIVSISVIPTMSARVLAKKASTREGWAAFRWAGTAATNIAGLVYWLCGTVKRRVATFVILVGVSVGGAWLLAPPAEYLPRGNRNLVFAIILPPPGYNLDELTGMARRIEAGLSPHFLQYEGKDVVAPKEPVISNFFFVAAGRQVFMGAIAREESRVRDLIPIMAGQLMEVPGLYPIVQQTSLFSRIGSARSIDLEITGPELPTLVGLGGQIFGQVRGLIPGSQVRPIPSLDLGSPEVRIHPDRLLAAKVGLSSEEIGIAVDVLLDGRKISEVKIDGREIDLLLKGEESYIRRDQDFESLPIATPRGKIVTLGDVADIRPTTGPEQINHIERQRNITIQVIPPEDVPLETAMANINEKILAPLRKAGRIGGLYNIRMAGTADDLDVTRRALTGNLLLALVITYLLMSALFESFLYPLVIMFSVPLAAVGGLLGLYLVNVFLTPQSLDVLTMLGFVILVGTVVNNAILIVHQALNLIRHEKMEEREAIRESVRTRIRPIFMSTMTSAFGMMPLILFPGAGSELYRGLGSVVVGGLIVSTIFTLFLVPTLFSLVLGAKRTAAGWWTRKEKTA